MDLNFRALLEPPPKTTMEEHVREGRDRNRLNEVKKVNGSQPHSHPDIFREASRLEETTYTVAYIEILRMKSKLLGAIGLLIMVLIRGRAGSSEGE